MSSKLLLVGTLLFSSSSFADAPTVVVAFDSSRLETPEGIVVDVFGNRYVTLALTSEVRRIARDGSQQTLARLPQGGPPLTPCAPEVGFVPIIGNLDIDLFGNLYVGVHSCNPAETGLYRIAPSGAVTLLASLPPRALPNGVEYRQGKVYFTDSAFGRVWRVPAQGGAAEIWSDDQLLKAPPGPFPAANGLQFFRGNFYVSNPGTGNILKISLEPNGTAGPARIHAQAPCDDFAFDVFGNLYCGTDPFNTVLRVFPDGGVETLLDINDGLDGPTAVAFGRTQNEIFDIYITNAAFPFFPNQQTPTLMRYRVYAPGAQ